jgi:lipopolysaccharide/colanic/teichoic acid biosynthesis glycosyltransferase
MAILTHERAMTERNNHTIALLAFHMGKSRINNASAQIMGRVLADRLRATDVAGWLDSHTIAVLLPNTQEKNAILVAEQICRRVLAGGIRMDYECYLYPLEGGASQGSSETSGESCKIGGSHPLADICVAPFPIWKRGLDIVLCLIGLAVFGPLMLLIALGIKIVSPGPVLFRQERVGFRGKSFVLFKFRSMKVLADTGVHQAHLVHLMEANARLTKLDKGDPRLIPFGKIFRASGLDELPQLFNILRGDMSLIGPRPCVPYEYEHFSQWQKRRCDAYPGLTGLWQVSGKNKTTFTEMMRLDIQYGRRQTLTKDLRILVKTIPAVMEQIRETSTDKR